MSATRCPECTAGKHGNCDGTTWDETTDAPGSCPCAEAGHLTPEDYWRILSIPLDGPMMRGETSPLRDVCAAWGPSSHKINHRPEDCPLDAAEHIEAVHAAWLAWAMARSPRFARRIGGNVSDDE